MKNTFNHKLVNMVKDFKDPWHRGKNNGVCEAFYEYWKEELRDTGHTDSPNLPTPANADVREWFYAAFKTSRKRQVLKALCL
nr:MAG TPA: hypothetical protein [Caudoviricetes sp.]